MDKSVKGALVGSVGVALLAGGFGTFATWTDSTSADLGTARTGHLEITEIGPATWDDLSTPGPKDDWTVATDHMVPGDEVRMTTPLHIDAEGKHLRVGVSVVNLPVQKVALGDDELTVFVTYAGQVAEITSGGSSTPLFEFDAADFDSLKDAQAEVTFKLAKNSSQNQRKTIDLSKVRVQAQQLN